MNAARLFLPVFFLVTFSVVAQKRNPSNLPIILNQGKQIECGTPLPPLKIAQEHERRMQQFILRGTNLMSPALIPIKAHIVRRSDGSGGLPIDTLNSAIAVMNAKYASMNMSFVICSSIHYIDSDELYVLDVDAQNNQLVLNNVNDAINIYFVGTLTATGIGLNGISEFPSADAAKNRIIMWNGATHNKITLAHEMGHYWNLYHTFETFFGVELADSSNCSIAGDLVCDTPADFYGASYDTDSCVYTGTNTDSQGHLYAPMVNNLMSYYGLCRDIFTTGQYTRMDAGYALRKMYMESSGAYSFACNAITALAPTNVTLSQVNCGLTISWTDNADNEMGYIIEKATSPAGPFVAIATIAANTNSFNDTRALTNGTTYYYRIIAANANAAYSNVAQINFNAGINCYCVPAAMVCNEGDAITNVKIKKGASVILNKNSACSVNGYSIDSTAIPTLDKEMTYLLSVSNASSYPEGATVWIDYNRNGVFESGEQIFTKASTFWASDSVSFTVPPNAQQGLTRLRIMLAYESTPTNPCSFPSQSFGYGETEDYWINIKCNVLESVVGAKRCGAGSVTLNASGCTGNTINWYSMPTGGIAIVTGGSFTTPALSASTTYYVACASGACAASRMPIMAGIIFNTLSLTNPTSSGTFLALETITSATNASTGTNYHAGKSVLLTPGFQVGGDEVFTASIQSLSCP